MTCSMSKTVHFVVMAGQSAAADGEILNAGLGRDIAVRDLAALVADPANGGHGVSIQHVVHDHPQAEKIPKLLCDNRAALRLLGWRPEIGLEEGIRHTRWIAQETGGAMSAATRPIPYGRQWIDDDDVAAVVKCLRGDWLTQGPQVAAFEKALCAATGAGYAVAVSSGTAALHLAALPRASAPATRPSPPRTLSLPARIVWPIAAASRISPTWTPQPA